MESIGFGIIGLGAIAALHVKALEDLTEATFVAGFDILPGRAQEFL
ncbi:hypothetical protein MASR2M78_03610 [Treponema sp.]